MCGTFTLNFHNPLGGLGMLKIRRSVVANDYFVLHQYTDFVFTLVY